MINIYKLKLTILQQEILSLLCRKAGSVLNQRQIANFLGVSPPAIMKALPNLEKLEGVILKQDKDSKRWEIELNRNNRRIMQLKRVENLRLVYESGLADFLEQVCAGASIILFGSYSRGDDTIRSDIDIAVVGRKVKKMDVLKYEKVLEKPIRINFYESWSKIHKNLKENLCSGIILTGGVEL